jgi:hypothetical protein
MKCQKARHSIRKNCPFRKSGRKISPYIFFHLCFHLDGSMSLNGNVPLIVMYIFYFKPQTNHQLTHQLGWFFVAVNSSRPPKEENQTCALKMNKCSIKPGFCWGVYLLLINCWVIRLYLLIWAVSENVRNTLENHHNSGWLTGNSSSWIIRIFNTHT